MGNFESVKAGGGREMVVVDVNCVPSRDIECLIEDRSALCSFLAKTCGELFVPFDGVTEGEKLPFDTYYTVDLE